MSLIPYTHNLAPKLSDPGIPPHAAADSITLVRALNEYEGEVPTILQPAVRRAEDVAAEYARTQIVLTFSPAATSPVIEHAPKVSQKYKDEVAEESTGAIPISVDELFGDDDPEEKFDNVDMDVLAHELAQQAEDAKEIQQEYEAAQQAQENLRMSKIQALIAKVALRRLAKEGNIDAADLYSRSSEILAPADTISARALALPLGVLLLASHLGKHLK